MQSLEPLFRQMFLPKFYGDFIVPFLQEKGMSVSAQTSEDTELRYREKYVLRDGRPEMEAK